MNDIAIRVENLGKAVQRSNDNTIWALKDVSFEACPEGCRRMQRGEVVDISSLRQAQYKRQVVRQTHHGAQGRQDKPGDEEEGNLMKFEKNIAEIIRTITESVQPEQIILFGSRARGVAHRYSDYDIALAGVNMDHRVERHLKEALDDRLGIFAVDLIDIDKVDPEFKELIMQNGVVIYEN